MQIHYTPLFKFGFRHDYFPKGECPVIRSVPAQETSRTMKAVGVRMVQREFGEECFYNDAPPPGGQLLPADAPVRLTFLLRATDPLFPNYTALSSRYAAGQVHYFTNLHTQEPTAGFTAGGASELPARSAFFELEVDKTVESIWLFDELDNQLHSSSDNLQNDNLPIRLPEGDPDEEVQFKTCRLNLTQEPPGRYSLRTEDATLLDFVLLPENWQAGDLGLFSVYLGDTGAQVPPMLQDGAITPADYTITFPCRETQWRYHFIDQGEPGYEDFQLIEEATQRVVATGATPPLTRTLADGTEAILLMPPTPIPLRQRPGSRFTLSMKAKNSSRSTPVTLPLPSADAARLSLADPPPQATDEEASHLFYSDLYVYL